MPVRWAMAGCKAQAQSILDALEAEGFVPDFVAVPPHAPDVDRTVMTEWSNRRQRDVLFSKRLTEHLDRLERLDLLLVCRFELLPAEVFSRPRLGTVNVHSSLLPQYRGIHPVSWALVDGAAETGVTLHVIDEEVDTGPVLCQEALRIEDRHNLHTLTQDLDVLSSRMVVGLMRYVATKESLPAARRQVGRQSYARRRRPQDGRIDWNRRARDVFNLVRALPPPLPLAFGELVDGGRVEFTACELLDESVSDPPGTVKVQDGRTLVVTCGDGRLARLVTSVAVSSIPHFRP